MRLIDADALFEHKVYAETPTISGDFVPGFVIDRAPTIDAVPVVRCKDCQYAIPLDGLGGNNALNCTECRGDDGFGMAGVSLAYHDGFCDRGVRRGCEPHD